MMKGFKKALSLVLVSALILACFALMPVANAATGGNIAFGVDSKSVNKGDTFTVNVNIDTNPGITLLRLNVQFDSSVLTLKSVEDKGVLGVFTPDDTMSSPVGLVWYNGLSTENFTVTGAIATLTFEATGDVTEQVAETAIKLSLPSPNDVLNKDLERLTPSFTDGKITVYPQGVPMLKFDRGLSMDIKDNLKVNYLVSEESLLSYTDPYVVFEMNGTTRTVRTYTTSNGVCHFAFSNIAPDYMTDTIKATIYAKYNGVEIKGQSVEYSIVKYCQLLLSQYSYSSHPEMNRLIVDLLNYGSALQIYNNRNTTSLANAVLTDTQKGYATPSNTDPRLTHTMSREEMGTNYTTTTFKSVAVMIQDSVGMEYVFESDIDPSELHVRVERNSGYVDFTSTDSEYRLTYGTPDANGKYTYSVKYRGISAAGLRTPLYFTVYKGSDPVSYRVCTSVEAYGKLVKGHYGDTLDDVVKKMMFYGDSADAYNKIL